MKYYNFSCIECEDQISFKIYEYSMEKYNQPLCINCQYWLNDIQNNTTATEESITLYFALKKRGVPAEIEKHDGFKTIDIAVPEAKVNIEVDGLHHKYNGNQAIRDLKRILNSYAKGYLTLHIPNAIVNNNLEEAADLITEYLNLSNLKHRKLR